MITNNDIFRRLRFAFDYEDNQMMDIFGLADLEVSRAQVSSWLKKDIDPDFAIITDKELATFLNGFISYRRGKKDGPQPVPENSLNNNQIFRKLKIGLAYKDVDVVDVMQLVDFKISKHEVNAFLRNPKQNQYRLLQDQILRNFIYALQKKYNPLLKDEEE